MTPIPNDIALSLWRHLPRILAAVDNDKVRSSARLANAQRVLSLAYKRMVKNSASKDISTNPPNNAIV